VFRCKAMCSHKGELHSEESKGLGSEALGSHCILNLKKTQLSFCQQKVAAA